MLSRRVDSARALRALRGTTLVAIGNFDGVHRGHVHVLTSAVELARAKQIAPIVLTFHPHPTEVLGQGRRDVLTPVERKIDLICRIAPELRVVVEPFTKELASMSPRCFAEDLLCEQLGARVVMVGRNFRFGHRRSGDLEQLEALGTELGFEARAEPLHGDETGTYSSSRIREVIRAGELSAAEDLLGRPHALTGIVIRGDQRGRQIGVPTANLADVEEELPPNGVYACLVDFLDEVGKPRCLGTGVANVGYRPTVAAGFSVEVHVFDFSGDLYGSRLRMHLVKHLRDEQKFAGLQELTEQIHRDIGEARRVTRERQPDPHATGAWY